MNYLVFGLNPPPWGSESGDITHGIFWHFFCYFQYLVQVGCQIIVYAVAAVRSSRLQVFYIRKLY